MATFYPNLLPNPPRARFLLAIILVALAGATAGCAGDTSGGGATKEEQPSTEAEAEDEAVAVSDACRAAMAKYHRALVRSNRDLEDGFDPSDYNPDEGPFQVATLKACKSGAEWLAEVQPYAEGARVSRACGRRVLVAMCGGNEKLPACRE